MPVMCMCVHTRMGHIRDKKIAAAQKLNLRCFICSCSGDLGCSSNPSLSGRLAWADKFPPDTLHGGRGAPSSMHWPYFPLGGTVPSERALQGLWLTLSRALHFTVILLQESPNSLDGNSNWWQLKISSQPHLRYPSAVSKGNVQSLVGL